MQTRLGLRLRLASLGLAVALPMTMGAKGDGCAANSRSPAPDVVGTWEITYDDQLDVEITIGGSTYTESLGAQGGVVTITHNGQPFSFDLDCDRPDILCPSEAWPTTVTAEQRNAEFEHRMIVTLPQQTCSGNLVAPQSSSCGPGTDNPDCDDVCDGEITVSERETFGVIGESGDSFRLYLGAGIATNGINCALFGWSVADAELVTVNEGTDAWEATDMAAGLVEIGYAGGCLWVGDPNMDQELEALAVGASIKFTTGFTGHKQ